MAATPAKSDRVEDVPRSALGIGQSLLAWAGWKLGMPSEWQPLKLEGTPEKGQMIVGDAECAVFLVKWKRPHDRSVSDGNEWVADRFKRLGVTPDRNPPAEARFTACGWVHGIQTEEGKETTYWFGYSAPGRLLLSMTVNGVLPVSVRETVVEDVLPSLSVDPADADSTWAMHDVSFKVPAGFELAQRHLFSGDVALEFERGRKETLLLRQVYPGELALRRRSAEAWLTSYPFKVHRRLRSETARTRPWRHGRRQGLKGVERHGWNRLPVPLGWCAPRETRALAVHDRELNRLLVAEHMARGKAERSVCVEAVEAMNSGFEMMVADEADERR